MCVCCISFKPYSPFAASHCKQVISSKNCRLSSRSSSSICLRNSSLRASSHSRFRVVAPPLSRPSSPQLLLVLKIGFSNILYGVLVVAPRSPFSVSQDLHRLLDQQQFLQSLLPTHLLLDRKIGRRSKSIRDWMISRADALLLSCRHTALPFSIIIGTSERCKVESPAPRLLLK